MSSYLPPVRCIIEKRYAIKHRMKYIALALLLISTAPMTYQVVRNIPMIVNSPNVSPMYYSGKWDFFWSSLMGAATWSVVPIVPALILIFLSNPPTNWLLPISPPVARNADTISSI